MSEAGIYVRERSYEVSVWPDEIECIDSGTWKLTVEYRGDGLWGVTRGGFAWLRQDRSWDYDREPVADAGPDRNRFPLDEALVIAREQAPLVTINGMTATEVLERHRRKHPDGKCRA